MRGIIAALVLIVLLFFIVPLAIEGSTDECQALERHAVTNTASKMAGGSTNSTVFKAVNSVGQAAATGTIASTMMRENHPDVSSPISCTWYFWKSIF
jgi:hypothetical protein